MAYPTHRADPPQSRPMAPSQVDLAADRLSSPRVLANTFKLLVHTIAYAIVVLVREACVTIEPVARAQVGTLRTMLWKVGAVVKTTARRVRFHFSSTWPWQSLFGQVRQALASFVDQVGSVVRPRPTLPPPF